MSNDFFKKTRRDLDRIKAEHDLARSSYIPLWREGSDYVLPRKAQFFVSDGRRGDRRNQNIYDSTAVYAARIASAGMMSGITSPARQWKKLTLQDPELADIGSVKKWLHTVDRLMDTVFQRSNLYNVLPNIYESLLTYSTAAMIIEPDDEQVVRFFPYPIGSYWISQNSKLKVDTFIREFQLSARQVVEMFATDEKGNINWDKVSTHVKSLYENDTRESLVYVTHTIMPNDRYLPDSLDPKRKKYISYYYESGTTNLSSYGSLANTATDYTDNILKVSGFDYFRVMAPRWEVTGEDAYGNSCPAEVAIGDIKQLQLGEKKSLQAIDKIIDPPMIADNSLRQRKTSILPGGVTYGELKRDSLLMRPVHEINSYRIGEHEQKQAQVRSRIQQAFYTDLFLMMASSDRRQITAREIEERHEEKLLALGPVLERLNEDLLDPLIENTFKIMIEKDMIPEPPEEIQNADLKIEYVSVMAQAQKFVGLGSIERSFGFVANMAQIDPTVMDKLNMDEYVNEYANMTGTPPNLIRSNDEAGEIRQARAQMQAQQEKMQMQAQQASVAKDLSQTRLDEGSALDAVAGEEPA